MDAPANPAIAIAKNILFITLPVLNAMCIFFNQ
jgi:hypothetical protein